MTCTYIYLHYNHPPHSLTDPPSNLTVYIYIYIYIYMYMYMYMRVCNHVEEIVYAYLVV